MNKETQRIIIASILITLVAYFYPTFWHTENNLSPNSSEVESNQKPIEVSQTSFDIEQNIIKNKQNNNENYKNKIITIQNKLYSTTISNASGGTLLNSMMIEKNNDNYKYLQRDIEELDSQKQYASGNIILGDLVEPVILNGGGCNPCLAYYDNDLNQYEYIDNNFKVLTPNIKSDYFLNDNDTLEIEYEYEWNGMLIHKSVIFYGNSYETLHNYKLDNTINNNLEIVWRGGLQPIDQDDFDWVSGNAMIGQSGETESIKITNDERYIKREEYSGQTGWASVRTKYFIAALLSNTDSDYSTMGGYLDSQKGFPTYDVTLGYYNNKTINTSVYLGPLDIDYIANLNNTLDDTINFGFKIVRPIGKFVLWFLKIIHNTLNLNYGICLILFAGIIQFITSPLTKKTYESSQKMQKIQPLVKKIQEKYKDDSQKMNQEVMKIYKDKGVNPLGGCLPLLLQMPLLMAIFSVFRETIEFRGASFIFWINDLSQPDILFHLPFNIPLYGDHVAFLPILMGISIFLTQKLSMATMDPAQKPMMYIMNGFFILIFNSFPAGLNLYYTVYNLLNYYQQKTIRSKNQ